MPEEGGFSGYWTTGRLGMLQAGERALEEDFVSIFVSIVKA